MIEDGKSNNFILKKDHLFTRLILTKQHCFFVWKNVLKDFRTKICSSKLKKKKNFIEIIYLASWTKSSENASNCFIALVSLLLLNFQYIHYKFFIIVQGCSVPEKKLKANIHTTERLYNVSP